MVKKSYKGVCEKCGSCYGITWHHVGGGAKVHQSKHPLEAEWKKAGRKKVLLCRACHNVIHNHPRAVKRELDW